MCDCWLPAKNTCAHVCVSLACPPLFEHHAALCQRLQAPKQLAYVLERRHSSETALQQLLLLLLFILYMIASCPSGATGFELEPQSETLRALLFSAFAVVVVVLLCLVLPFICSLFRSLCPHMYTHIRFSQLRKTGVR